MRGSVTGEFFENAVKVAQRAEVAFHAYSRHIPIAAVYEVDRPFHSDAVYVVGEVHAHFRIEVSRQIARVHVHEFRRVDKRVVRTVLAYFYQQLFIVIIIA